MLPRSISEGPAGMRLHDALQRGLFALMIAALCGVVAAAFAPSALQFAVSVGSATVLAVALALGMSSEWLKRIQIVAYKNRVARINETQEQIEELFSMTDTLQAADSNADAAQVLQAAQAVDGVQIWDVTNHQDLHIQERQQVGLTSQRYVPGPNSPSQEPGIRAALRKYLEMMGEPS